MIINLNKEMISGGHSNMAPFPVIDYSVIFSNVDQQFGRVTPANAYFHTADWTLSYWWKLPAPAGNKFFYFQDGNLQSTMHAGLGYVRWRFEDVDGNTNIITSTINVCDGDWHHIAISCDRDGDIEMYVDGALDVTDDITAFSTSDKRLKNNISPIKQALDKVKSISGNTFDWNSASGKEGSDTGVIAQEVDALNLPGITTIRDDGTYAVRYEKLVPVLIEAIKELSTKVDNLEQKLSDK